MPMRHRLLRSGGETFTLKIVGRHQTFLATSRNGRSRSTPGSFGIPRMRSAMMLRWISSVPPAIDCPGTETKISVMIPSRGASRPASIPDAPAMSEWACDAERAILLVTNFPSDPSGPGGRPSARAAAARWAVHLAAEDRLRTLTISCRTTGSLFAPVAAARSTSRSTRPARCGYHLCGSLAALCSDVASRHTRPLALGEVRRREVVKRRSCAKVVSAAPQPCPTSPTTFGTGTRASSRNTSLNEAWPFICRSGRTTTAS